MKFDARSAKSLPAGEYLLFSDYPGLRFVASATTRTWIYRYKSPVDSKMRQYAIGGWPAVSFPAAIVAWEELRAKRDAGIDIAREHKLARAAQKAVSACKEAAETAYTVRMLCDDYLDGHIDRNRASGGAKAVRCMFESKLAPIAGLSAGEITRSIAFEFINQYAIKTPMQAKMLRSELGAAWDYAIDAGRLSDSTPNWWRLILKNKIRTKGRTQNGENIGTDKRVLSDGEIGELLDWLPNFSDVVADVLTMYLWTAARGGEIVAIMGSEIHQEGDLCWWVAPKSKTKNARHEKATDLRIPLFGRALSIVQRRCKIYGSGYLFPLVNNRGLNKADDHIKQNYVSSKVYVHQPYADAPAYGDLPKMPVTRWSPHDLRRTSRTLLAKLGCPESVGEAILGHVPAQLIGTYNRHNYDDEKVVWMKRLSDCLESLVIQHR